MRRILVLVAVLVGWAAPPARADDSFDQLARGATEVVGPEGLAALFWSLLAECKPDGDDFTRRQCEGVREARRAKMAAATFLITADGAVEPQPYNEKAMSIDIAVRACAACKGVEVAGQRRTIVGRGDLKVVGGRVRAAELHSGTRTFKTRAEGRTWSTTVAPRLRADFLIRIPPALQSWSEGGASGFRIEVVGFRVVDPCTGQVLWAKPPAANVVADPSASRCPATSKRRRAK